jgi:predicted TIM-barrel fold metal-dependent hydrolase
MATQETDGQAQAKQEIQRLKGNTVVDCDIHEIVTDPNVLEPYLDSPWAERVEHVTSTSDPLSQSIIGTQPHDVDPAPLGLGDDISPVSPEGVAAFMDRFHTDYVILHGHTIEAISDVPEKEFAAALCSAYNDFLLDEYLDEHEGFKTSIRVPPQHPRAAVEEIDRLANESDMVGVHIPAAASDRLLGDSKYEPIYAAAAEKGLPIDVHPSQVNIPWAGTWGGPWLQSSVEIVSLISHSGIAHIPSLIFQGIPDNYPELDFLFVEQGVVWIPAVQGRMDKNYQQRKHALPWLERKPSEYLQESFYFGTQPMEDAAGPANLMRVLNHIDAEDMLVYTSDWPHFDFDYPSLLTLPELSDSAERKIFGENAMEIFDL